MARFPFGRLLATPAALDVLSEAGVSLWDLLRATGQGIGET